jgi:beta-N-acetylhexosaminidase
VILFDYDVPSRSPVRNIASPTQVGGLIAGLQGAASIPLLVAVDQEGGKVARLKEKHGFPPTLSAADLGAGSPERTRREAVRMAQALARAGINLNLAPVVDLNVRPDNPVIGALGRSFGSDSASVIRHARAFVLGHRDQGVLCALKHFPGHGSSAADSHLGLADVTSSWSEEELEPFARLVREGLADAVMTAHVFNARLDSERPATLSPAIVTGILRRQLGFDGVVLSDDLQMGAITAHYGLEAAILAALEADLDILVFGNNISYDPAIAAKAITVIRRLVDDGKITPERIDRSFRRILTLKKKLSQVPPAAPVSQ